MSQTQENTITLIMNREKDRRETRSAKKAEEKNPNSVETQLSQLSSMHPSENGAHSSSQPDPYQQGDHVNNNTADRQHHSEDQRDTAGSQSGYDSEGDGDECDDNDLLDNIMQRIQILEEANRSKDDHIKLLYAEISMLKQDKQRQEEKQNDIITRSMNQNIVLSGKHALLNEIQHEDCKAIVETVINDYIKPRHGTVTVIRAHRLGNSDSTRPIVARLGGREDVTNVMKRSGLLAGTDIYVNPQYPQAIDERRSFIQSYRKSAKNQGATAKISVDKLYVNNELRKDLLPPCIPPQAPPIFSELPVTSTTRVRENEHCQVQISLAKSTSMEEVGNAMTAVLLRSRSSPNGIVYAYRYTQGSKLYRNYDSGSEHGLGTRLLKLMDEKHLQDKTLVMHIWYKKPGTKARGKNFNDLMTQCVEELM